MARREEKSVGSSTKQLSLTIERSDFLLNYILAEALF